MKLYSILFEEKFNSYQPPEYAMVDWQGETEKGFALLHVENFKAWVENGLMGSPNDWLCAYCGVKTVHENDCKKAVETNYIVRSPQFPGAGSVMYALISDYYQKPITSDRLSSTSNSAKKAWAKIESSSDWTKVELDNYYQHNTRYPKYWFRFDGSWPNRTGKNEDENGQPLKPLTPEDESDDCRLPVSSGEPVNAVLGTANAWLYHGPFKAGPLLDHGDEILNSIGTNNGASREELKEKIKSQAFKLYRSQYKGIEG
jgi:hypothetical protein